MTTASDHDIKVLNCLIEITIDSADGYAKAAEVAGDTRYSAVFRQRALERRHVVRMLQQQVRVLGGEPEDDGTLLGKAHRLFVDLHVKMASNEGTAIVDKVESGEDVIKTKYLESLGDPKIAAATRSTIEEAFISVQSGHDQMRDLKHALHGVD